MTDCRYRVLGEMILVKKELKRTETGLLIPEEAKKSGQLCLKGRVLNIGPSVTRVKVGEVVIFNGYAGSFLQIEDSFEEPDLIVMREDEVLVVDEQADAT